MRCVVAAAAATVAASTKYCSRRNSHHLLTRHMILTLRIIGCYGCYSNFYWLLQRLLRLLQKATRANYGCYGNSYWLLQWLPRLLRNDNERVVAVQCLLLAATAAATKRHTNDRIKVLTYRDGLTAPGPVERKKHRSLKGCMQA